MGIREEAYMLKTLKDCMCEAMCEGRDCEDCILSTLTRENWGRLKLSDLMWTANQREARRKRGWRVIVL